MFTIIIYLYSLFCSFMIILDQDLFSIEDFLSISVILRSLSTLYEDWKRIRFSRTLDWYHLSQLKMTSAHYWGLSVRIVLNIWEPLSSFWEGRLMKNNILWKENHFLTCRLEFSHFWSKKWIWGLYDDFL